MGNKARSGLPRGIKDTTAKIQQQGDFRVFADKADGGWSFDGDGKDTVAFFNQASNYAQLISQMSPEDIDAFSMWAVGHFMHGQQYRGFTNMRDYERKYTKIYDKFLDKATLNEGIVVHRLAGFELINNGSSATMTLPDIQKKIGNKIISKGNMSTAAASEGLTIGDSKKRVDYEIHIPKGSTGAGMWIGDSRINDWGNRQREFMVNRDTVYTIEDVTYSKATQRFKVILHYKGRQKHDYS